MSRPKRARRKPARLLSSVAVAGICAGADSQTVPKSGYLSDDNTVNTTDLSTIKKNCHLVESSERFVDESMPDKGKRPARKRRRRNSRDRGDRQDGDHPIGVCNHASCSCRVGADVARKTITLPTTFEVSCVCHEIR